MAEYIDRNLIEWYGCDFENDSCKNRECSGCHLAECSHSQVMGIPTANVIEIPKGATNGDMIKALFSNIDASVSGDGDVIDVYNLGIYCQTFDTEWWNAPYKKG